MNAPWMRHARWAWICGIVLTHAVVHAAAAQQPVQPQAQSIPVDKLLRNLKFGELSTPAFAPDGTWITYVIQDNAKNRVSVRGATHSTVPSWAAGSDIMIVRADNGVVKNLTGGIGSNWAPTWSPNGRYLSFFSDRDHPDRDRRDSAGLWVWDRSTDRVRKVASLAVQSLHVEWTPDSKSIILPIGSPGQTPERPPAAIARAPSPRVAPADSISTSAVMVYTFHPPSDGAHGSDSAHASATSDPWSLDSYLHDLAMVGVEHGNVHLLLRHQRFGTFALSPDGSHVAYTRVVRFERPGSQQLLYDLRSIDLATGGDTLLAPNIRMSYDGASFSWSPSADQLAYQLAGMDEKGNDCYVVALHDAHPHQLAPTSARADTGRQGGAPPLWHGPSELFYLHRGTIWRGDVAHGTASVVGDVPHRTIRELVARGPNALWTDANGAATVVLTRDDVGKQDGFYRIDLTTGASTPLREAGQCYRCGNLAATALATADGHRLAYFAEDASHPSDLWVTDPTFRAPNRLTHLNPELDQYVLGTARLIEWRSIDGEPLHGVLLLPSTYREGTRYPLIVYVYGGERLSNSFDQFGSAASGPLNMQLFATRGYAVLLPDAPQHAGTPMVDLAKTVLPGVSKVVEMGVADSTRLGVMGHSYGGYTTLSLIVQTTRFKAAVAADGMGDLISAYGQMDTSGTAFQTSIMEAGQGLLIGTPWQVRERYIENSPIMYLDRVTTPLLLIHGAEDQTVSSFLSDEVFVDLRRLGKEVEYVKYRGEDHSPLYWRYANQVDFDTRLIAWFDGHLKP